MDSPFLTSKLNKSISKEQLSQGVQLNLFKGFTIRLRKDFLNHVRVGYCQPWLALSRTSTGRSSRTWLTTRGKKEPNSEGHRVRTGFSLIELQRKYVGSRLCSRRLDGRQGLVCLAFENGSQFSTGSIWMSIRISESEWVCLWRSGKVMVAGVAESDHRGRWKW